MPENNNVRANRLKKYLLDRKRKMWNDLRDEFFRKLGKEYNTQFDNPHDLEELGIIDLIEDLGIAVADLKKQEIIQIEEAMRKLEDGTYGVCSKCGEDIDEERLKVILFATECVRCAKDGDKRKLPTL